MKNKVKLSSSFESTLFYFLKTRYYPHTRFHQAAYKKWNSKDLKFFSSRVSELHRIFTHDRQDRPKNYFNRKDLRSGYFLYFLPVNALKTMSLLNNISHDFWRKRTERPIRILDVGMGPGSGIFGVLFYFQKLLEQQIIKKCTLEFCGLDQNKMVLNESSRLFELYQEGQKDSALSFSLTTRLCDISYKHLSPSLFSGSFDLVLFSNVLSEIGDIPRRLRALKYFSHHFLKEDGLILIIEPALQRETRQLMELHDSLIEETSLKVLSPCLHQFSCPMLLHNRRDWCHTYLEWEPTPLLAAIDRMVGIRKDYLKCSYLVLAQRDLEEFSFFHKRDFWRVVSSLLPSKGKSECLFCGSKSLPHLLRVTRFDRDISPSNKVWDQLSRGDVVQYSGREKLLKDEKMIKVSPSLTLLRGV